MLKGARLIRKRILSQKKNHRAPLIPYLTAFDPDRETTKSILLELAEVDPPCLELGFPFSDPVADGPTIQKAMVRALNNSPTFEEYLELVHSLRDKGFSIPILCMTYYNILYRFGLDRLLSEASSAGLDGFIVPDLPLEEAGPLRRRLKGSPLALVMLCAPTSSPERIAKIARATRGFLYYVSLTGITGARESLPVDLVERLKIIKTLSPEPVAVGFGISKPEHVAMLLPYTDALVVGSALVRLIEENPKKAPQTIKTFLQKLMNP